MKHFVFVFLLYTVSLEIHNLFIAQKSELKYDSVLNKVVCDVLLTLKVWVFFVVSNAINTNKI